MNLSFSKTVLVVSSLSTMCIDVESADNIKKTIRKETSNIRQNIKKLKKKVENIDTKIAEHDVVHDAQLSGLQEDIDATNTKIAEHNVVHEQQFDDPLKRIIYMIWCNRC